MMVLRPRAPSPLVTATRGFGSLNPFEPALKAPFDDWEADVLNAAELRARHSNERLARRRRYKADLAAAPELQKDLLRLLEGAEFPLTRKRPGGPPVLPGLWDQELAAEERRWRHGQARQLRATARREIRIQRLPVFKYAVTLARPEWILATLDPAILPAIRKQVQRQAKRLPWPFSVTGVIDVCPMRDDQSGVRGWAFHVHLTIVLGVPDYNAGQALIETAFPYKPDSARGVPNPRCVKEVYDSAGWDYYQGKLLQWGGVRQRIVRVDPVTGNRLPAHKPHMSKAQQVEFAIFMGKVDARNFEIWVRYRRYKTRVLPMAMSPMKNGNR